MGFKDLREWIKKLESEGELKRITAKVDWDEEIGTITRKVFAEGGPALLFENIKGYENTWCKKLFTGGLASKERMAMMLGLGKGAGWREMIQLTKNRINEPLKPKLVNKGPVKENIIKGKDVDLLQIPVPKWHPLDGGRYIDTFCGVVTRDPDTGVHNIGLYRGMIHDRNKIGVLLVPSMHWGLHYQKYQGKREPMPVAVVYGWDPSMVFMACAPVQNVCEYDVMGAIRQEPVELIKCETVDILVPASAEIVIEGTISPDPSTYMEEGPFAEYTGYYGEREKRPWIDVKCITHRNDPIFRGTLEGQRPGKPNEDSYMYIVSYAAIGLDILEKQGVPGILDITGGTTTVVQIKKMYRGHAKHVANALWGSAAGQYGYKNIIVVEEDIDIRNWRSLEWALSYRTNAGEGDIVVMPGSFGAVLDPATRIEDRKEMKYGTGKWNRLLIDATRNWDYPKVEQWGGNIYPPLATMVSSKYEDLVDKKWKEYGF